MNVLCECCGKNRSVHKHHKFSQTKWARKLYGKLLDSPINISYVCPDCHASHINPNLERFTELEFCEALGIKPRSKGIIKSYEDLKKQNM